MMAKRTTQRRPAAMPAADGSQEGLRQKLAAFEKERDDLVRQVNERLAYLGGRIDMIRELLGIGEAVTPAPPGEELPAEGIKAPPEETP